MVSQSPAPSSGVILSPDQIPLACDCRGRGEPLLLFIHGWTCRATHWQPQLKHFSSSFTVAATDLPGHGNSPAGDRRCWTIVNLARDIVACAAALTPDRVVLVGHSMGGAVALEAARLLGKKVSGVVLGDTFVIDYGGLTPEAVQAIAAPFESDFPNAMATLVEQTSTAATPPELKRRLVRDMTSADPAWALPLWHDLLSWSPDAAFAELQVPLYAINGALIPESARKRCAPFVAETIMPGAGHFLQMEDPQGFNLILERILTDLR